MKENQTYDRKSLRSVYGKTADFDEIAKDCVAFANREGGHLAIGIEDDQELPDPSQRISDALKETVVKRINERTINVALVPNIIRMENGGEYLDLEVLRSAVSIASTTKGGYFIRDNDESKPIAPDELLRAITDKPSFSWETKVTLKYKIDQCDKEKLENLIEKIRSSDRVSAFVKSMTTEETLEYYSLVGDDGYLTNLGVLWLGTQPQRARLLYSPTVQFIRYDAGGNKVFKQVWDDYALNPDELLTAIWNSVPDWRESNEVSDGLWRKEIPAYDEKVVRETLCNAIAHRPYTTRGDVFINIYPDRMEVVNPGRLPLGVTPENILRTTVKRNKELSRLFYALHIMEGEGSGYDLMYETQLSLGKSIPVVKEGEDSVSVTIERKIISKEASRIYDYLQYAYPEVISHQKAMIAFGLILQEEIIASETLSRKLQLPEADRLRSYVDILCTKNIVLTRGRGKGTKYYVNPYIISNSRANIRTTLKTIEPYRLKELILQDLKYHPKSLVSEMSERLPDVSFTELQKQVRKMASNGEVLFEGGRKYRRYSLP
ncbi:MAG: putative DNA binding domain-containing protein [Prevotella sp.]|nr:putative DNA binding domain-containing protein [Prevotella sp.]